MQTYETSGFCINCKKRRRTPFGTAPELAGAGTAFLTLRTGELLSLEKILIQESRSGGPLATSDLKLLSFSEFYVLGKILSRLITGKPRYRSAPKIEKSQV